MAGNGESILHRFPQSKAVDAVRWLPAISAFDRLVAAAVHDPDTGSSALEIHTLDSVQNVDESPVYELVARDSWPSASRISSFRCSAASSEPITIAASTFAGTVHFLFVDPVEGSVESELSLHSGPVTSVDLQIDGRECVSVGEDGRVNLVRMGDGGLESRRVHDGKGLVSYTAVRWGSSVEFATGGLGFGLQWWDNRKPGGPVSHLGGDWIQRSGIIHSIDIHPSRKHICLAGGSSGAVFAWDLRWQKHPVLLSGSDPVKQKQSICESDVWEIQYDGLIQSGSISAPPAQILPVMICSEDGILGVLEQGKEPIELMAEPCAINAFDIDKRNPSDIICSLEWEAISLLIRL